jgi:hypothetical protein
MCFQLVTSSRLARVFKHPSKTGSYALMRGMGLPSYQQHLGTPP